MKSYNARLAELIAHELLNKSRKKWRSLQDDAQRKIKMSETTNNMNTQSSAVPAPIAPRVDQKNLVTGEDSRAKALAADVTAAFKTQAGPRGETNENEAAGA